MEPDAPGGPPKMPKWVKVFLAIGIAFVVLLVGVLVFGGPEHGPGRHGGTHEGNSPSDSPTGSHSPPPTHHGASGNDAGFLERGPSAPDSSEARRSH